MNGTVNGEQSALLAKRKLTHRSETNFEFSVQNASGHMNCFLNSALQLIWSLTLGKEKKELTQLIEMPIKQGPALLRPLIGALQEFFR